MIWNLGRYPCSGQREDLDLAQLARLCWSLPLLLSSPLLSLKWGCLKALRQGWKRPKVSGGGETRSSQPGNLWRSWLLWGSTTGRATTVSTKDCWEFPLQQSPTSLPALTFSVATLAPPPSSSMSATSPAGGRDDLGSTGTWWWSRGEVGTRTSPSSPSPPTPSSPGAHSPSGPDCWLEACTYIQGCSPTLPGNQGEKELQKRERMNDSGASQGGKGELANGPIAEETPGQPAHLLDLCSFQSFDTQYFLTFIRVIFIFTNVILWTRCRQDTRTTSLPTR